MRSSISCWSFAGKSGGAGREKEPTLRVVLKKINERRGGNRIRASIVVIGLLIVREEMKRRVVMTHVSGLDSCSKGLTFPHCFIWQCYHLTYNQKISTRILHLTPKTCVHESSPQRWLFVAPLSTGAEIFLLNVFNHIICDAKNLLEEMHNYLSLSWLTPC